MKTFIMPLLNSKLKCPRCGAIISKDTLKLTNGKCNYCGYLIVSPLKIFIKNK